MKRAIGGYVNYFMASGWVVLVPLCVVFLNTVGLLILSSASLSFVHHNYLLKQAAWLALAVVGCVCAMSTPINWLLKNARFAYILAIVLLIVVLIPGIGLRINGSRRWINVGVGNLQISEYAKIAFCLYFPRVLIRSAHRSFSQSLLIPLAHMGVFAVLLLLEPDYGTTALFLLTGMALLFLNGFSAKTLFACGIIILGLFALMIVLNPVRMARLLAFMDMEATKATGSYQLWQGFVAFQSGGLCGAGLGNGRQQLFFLPEAHTDFIFPILAEELGYIFALLVVCAYIVLFVILWRETFHMQAPDLFLAANGLSLFLIIQIAINLCVVMGLLPTKGIALPFVSYGGSSLIFSYCTIGLLLNLFRTSHREDLSWDSNDNSARNGSLIGLKRNLN
ncbi:MAG: putative lipid II flippase FtsW [Puniceicoccales bacterium]|jgi:cell division protein FtsW|nr:putative lipid II flippase FtsW [Puniceicoccales bacterium]